MTSSATVYDSVPLGRPADVAPDRIVPRSQSTLPEYVSSGRWLKMGCRSSHAEQAMQLFHVVEWLKKSHLSMESQKAMQPSGVAL